MKFTIYKGHLIDLYKKYDKLYCELSPQPKALNLELVKLTKSFFI